MVLRLQQTLVLRIQAEVAVDMEVAALAAAQLEQAAPVS